MPFTRTLTGPLIGILLVALTGCGASEVPATKSSAPTVSPSAAAAPVRAKDAKIVRGTGYAFALPKGWVNQTRKVRRAQPSVDVAVGAAVRTGRVADSMTVVVRPEGRAGADGIDDVANRILASMKPMAPDYTIRPHTTVAGVSAAHLAGLYQRSKQRFWFEQFVVLGSDQATVISFAMDPGTPQRARNQLIDRVLKSWSIEP